MKLSKSQLFSFFVLFWIGLGFLGILLSLIGFFYKSIIIVYLVIGICGLLYLFFSNLKLLRLIHPGFISAAAIMIIFFLCFHMVIDPQARTKLLVGVSVILLMVLLFGLPLYAKFLRGESKTILDVVNSAQREKAEPNIVSGIK